jgi:diaminopimelate decarboxylase
MSFANDPLISLASAAAIANEITDNTLLNERDTSFVVYSFQKLNQTLQEVKNAFPSYWQHAVAIKTNPLAKVLEHISELNYGLEAASYEEVCLAKNAAAPFIIWDSPVKTKEEIETVLMLPSKLIINANSLEEFIALTKSPHENHIQIGLRINPEMKLSSMSSMTVGASGSKFGEPISNVQAIASTIQSLTRKVGLHVHASSQNMNLEESASAIKKVCDLAIAIGLKHISYIDIGGGFPVNYGFSACPEIKKYAQILEKECPMLFNQSVDVFTEFGRFYHANAGFHISKINEVKGFTNHQTIANHLGADMFLRESYQPGKWMHRFGIMNAQFQLKQGPSVETSIGGPLCFGGDYLVKNELLPKAAQDDYLIIMDTGANSFALWSMHCSRTFPKVIGIKSDGNPFILKERQNIEDIIRFWS